MNFTKEQIVKAMSAKSADELFALANEGGVLITMMKQDCISPLSIRKAS